MDPKKLMAALAVALLFGSVAGPAGALLPAGGKVRAGPMSVRSHVLHEPAHDGDHSDQHPGHSGDSGDQSGSGTSSPDHSDNPGDPGGPGEIEYPGEVGDPREGGDSGGDPGDEGDSSGEHDSCPSVSSGAPGFGPVTVCPGGSGS